MEIILRLENFKLIEKNKNWFNDKSILELLLSIIEKTIWGERFRYYYRFKDDKIRTIDTINGLATIITENKEDTYVIQDSESENISCGMYLNISEFGFNIILFDNNTSINLIVKSMIELTTNLHSNFNRKFLIGYRLGIELYGLENYKPDETVITDFWECYKIVDFLSLKFHTNSEIGRLKDFKKISEYNFTTNVKKYIKNDDLLIIDWVENKNDEKIISNSMSQRDQWIYKNLEN